MKPLPKEFLDRIADEYDLTAKQQEAFVAYYQNPNKTQEFIADELEISASAFRVRLQEIYKKFSIHKEATDKARELHDILWRKYQEKYSEAEAIQAEARIEAQNEIEALVQQVREKICPDIKQRCDTMKVLDMTQSIGLGDIYTNVNILKKITSRRRLGLADLQESCNFNIAEFDRFGFGKVEKRVPGLEAVKNHSKLMVWGKPGAGKTTFLKYLAMQCNAGEFQKERVPIFVTLKAYAEAENKPKLLHYIQTKAQDFEIDNSAIEQLFKKGKLSRIQKTYNTNKS
jgi:predicted NACHT family NTPase